MQKLLIVFALAAALGCSGGEALRIVEVEPTVWVDRMPGPDGPSLHVLALATLNESLAESEEVAVRVELEADGETIALTTERVERIERESGTTVRAIASAPATAKIKTATMTITLDVRGEQTVARVEAVEIQAVY
jgi:hypothetical protein